MNRVINISNDNFDVIDFTESTIVCLDILNEHNPPKEIFFEVWGATLLLNPMWEHTEVIDFKPCKALKDNDLYVSDVGMVHITNVVGGMITVYKYASVLDSYNRISIMKDENGNEVTLEKKWGIEKTIGRDEYVWECVIALPYGFCRMSLISANGEITFEFDDANIISADTCVRDPHKYSYQIKK